MSVDRTAIKRAEPPLDASSSGSEHSYVYKNSASAVPTPRTLTNSAVGTFGRQNSPRPPPIAIPRSNAPSVAGSAYPYVPRESAGGPPAAPVVYNFASSGKGTVSIGGASSLTVPRSRANTALSATAGDFSSGGGGDAIPAIPRSSNNNFNGIQSNSGGMNSNTTNANLVGLQPHPLAGLVAPQATYGFVQACAYKGSMGRLYTRPNGIFFNSAPNSFQIAWRTVEKISAGSHSVGGQLVPILTIKVSAPGAKAAAAAEAFAFNDCAAYRAYCRREGTAIAETIVDHMTAFSEGVAAANGDGGGAGNGSILPSTRNMVPTPIHHSPMDSLNFPSPQDTNNGSPVAGGAAGRSASYGIDAMVDFLRRELAATNAGAPPNHQSLPAAKAGGAGAGGSSNQQSPQHNNSASTIGEIFGDTGKQSSSSPSSNSKKTGDTASLHGSLSSHKNIIGGGGADGAEGGSGRKADSQSNHSQQQQIVPISYSRTISGASMIGPLSTLASLAGTDDGELAPAGTYTFTIQTHSGDTQAVAGRLREQMAEHYKELCLLAIEERKYDLIAGMRGQDAAPVVESAAAMMLEFSSRCDKNPPQSLAEFYARLVEASTVIFVNRSRAGMGAGGVNGSGGNGSRSVWGPRLHSVAPEVVRRADEAIIAALNTSSATVAMAMGLGCSGIGGNPNAAAGTPAGGGLGGTFNGAPATSCVLSNTSIGSRGQGPTNASMAGLSGTHGSAYGGSSATTPGGANGSLANCGDQRLTEVARAAMASKAREQRNLDPSNFPLLYQTRGAAVAPRPKSARGNPLQSGFSPHSQGTGSSQGGSPAASMSPQTTTTVTPGTLTGRAASIGFAEAAGAAGDTPTFGSGASGDGSGGRLGAVMEMLRRVPFLCDAIEAVGSAFTYADDNAIKPAAIRIGKRIPKKLIKSKRTRIRLTRTVMLYTIAITTVCSIGYGAAGAYARCFPPPTAAEARAELHRLQLEATEKALGDFMFAGDAASAASAAPTSSTTSQQSPAAAFPTVAHSALSSATLLRQQRTAAAAAAAEGGDNTQQQQQHEAERVAAAEQRLRDHEAAEARDAARLVSLLRGAQDGVARMAPTLAQIAGVAAEVAEEDAALRGLQSVLSNTGELAGLADHLPERERSRLGLGASEADAEGRRLALEAIHLSRGLLLTKEEITSAVSRVALSRMSESLAASSAAADAAGPFGSYAAMWGVTDAASAERAQQLAHVSWLNFTNVLTFMLIVIVALAAAAKLNLLPI